MAEIDARARRALANAVQRRNLARFATAWREARDAQLPPERFLPLRDELRAARRRVVDRLPEYVERFRRAAEAAGVRVYLAATAEDANRYVTRLARERGVRLAVKSKSMATEETGLNAALAAAGVEAVETDLGEWIIQLAGERPSHMVMPAIHKDRRQTGRLLSAAAGRDLDPEDVSAQVATARRLLRERFLAAGMGVTGANALIAETGTVMLVTNEGNGRLVTTAPPVHVVVAGLDKIVPSFEDAVTLLRLLPRSATGQPFTSYVTFVTGPAAPDRELHVVLLDNGRSDLRAHPDFRDALLCIRCGACADVCPPYQMVGGHVFGGPVYTGAIGLVVSPFHHGLDSVAEAQSLCAACNACETVCPAG
ncbi:MAG TPA: LUD domain-containing protein, partial [Dehalococcoidia bacterium]